MSDDQEHYHRSTHDNELQVLLEGMEHTAVCFTGRPDVGTVTMYAIDVETGHREPILECDAGHFETLLEQASGGLIDAQEKGRQY